MWASSAVVPFWMAIICTLITIAIVVASVIRHVYLRRKNRTNGYWRNYDGEYWFLMAGAPALWLVFMLILTASTYPHRAEYHRWERTEGRVVEVGERLIPSGEAVQQRVVLDIEDVGPRGCDDTRCTLIEPGDTVTLDCKRSWQWAGEDGYRCAYVSHTSTSAAGQS